MNIPIKTLLSIFLLSLAVMLLQTACSSSGSSLPVSSADISRLTELSEETKALSAAQGGSITNDAFTVTFPAGALPADAQIRVSKGLISNSRQDAALVDLSEVYTVSTISSAEPLALTDSATIEFRINPAGFDPENIMLVTWNGYNWSETPAQYDATRRVLSSTREMILPFGTRIYSANPAKQKSTKPGVKKDAMTITEFIAVKVVGIAPGSATSLTADGRSSAAEASVVRAKYIYSQNFTVKYFQPGDEAQARAVSGYMENAYQKIVVEMGFKKPGPSSKDGYKNTWPVEFEEQDDAYARADSGNNIYVQPGTPPDDDLSHTCHHEFTHLVQYKTLTDAGNNSDDGMSWFDETMADAMGFYAQKGIGVMYSAADAYMGDFDMRLDSDEYSIPDNDDYEYVHFPFISYILHQYGYVKFRQFFETFYAYKPGKTAINMTRIDTPAAEKLGKAMTGRNGIFWDFFRDYYLAGNVFNKVGFLNLPNRTAGSPLAITEENQEDQGATIIKVLAGASEQKESAMLRLSGKALILRYADGSGNPLTLTVTVTSQPGHASGRIELVAFRNTGGILQPVGSAEEVSDGGQRQITYGNFGKDATEVYIVMANTSSSLDDYKVTVGVTAQ